MTGSQPEGVAEDLILLPQTPLLIQNWVEEKKLFFLNFLSSHLNEVL
jgi:hypothetical protein